MDIPGNPSCCIRKKCCSMERCATVGSSLARGLISLLACWKPSSINSRITVKDLCAIREFRWPVDHCDKMKSYGKRTHHYINHFGCSEPCDCVWLHPVV